MRFSLFIVLVLLLPARLTMAQDHDHHQVMAPADTVREDDKIIGGVIRSIPMAMEGSGTGWIPELSPMHMFMTEYGPWTSMMHGSVFIRYTKQGGPRGMAAWSSPNWFMGSFHRALGSRHQIMFRAMISLDRVTEGGDGYPLLLQSGETWMGSRLVDFQHPHDVFSELSVAWSSKLSESVTAFAYLAYPGEPALGPAAFMHRPSSAALPDAPISHHWQDATHISFGVATLGFVWKRIKLDASLFTGREPDENRFDFDRPRFDSRSARISANPTKEVSVQVSRGIIRNPEGDGSDVTRTTASILLSSKIGPSTLTAALIWGQNDEHHGRTNSYLIEASSTLGKFIIATRAELVEKPREELGISIDHERLERVSQWSVSLARWAVSLGGFDFSVGIQATTYALSTGLRQFYGSPVSFQGFLRLTPESHEMGSNPDEHSAH